VCNWFKRFKNSDSISVTKSASDAAVKEDELRNDEIKSRGPNFPYFSGDGS